MFTNGGERGAKDGAEALINYCPPTPPKRKDGHDYGTSQKEPYILPKKTHSLPKEHNTWHHSAKRAFHVTKEQGAESFINYSPPHPACKKRRF